MAAEISPDIRNVVAKNSLFLGKTLLIEKNENSSLIQKVKPCNLEFFEKLFNGLFWDAYAGLGFASKPFKSQYFFLVGSEMFFCKNTQQRFLNRIGLEKSFSYKNGQISESASLSFANLVFLAAAPFEIARNAASMAISAFKVNSELNSFEKYYKKSLLFWRTNQAVEDPVGLSSIAMENALASMRYSLLSSIAASLKIGLKKGFATEKNLLGELVKQASSESKARLMKEHGYFSISPYDISRPFLEEAADIAGLLAKTPKPTEAHYIWRENAKLCASMHLSILRNCFLAVGKKAVLGNDVFFLKQSELGLALFEPNKAREKCLQRKRVFEKNLAFSLPRRIIICGEKSFLEKREKVEIMSGLSVGSKLVAEGKLVFVEDSKSLLRVSKGDIIFSKNFSPELVLFYGKCSAVISESGSMLAHSAIVARESNLPCIVQAKGTAALKDGAKVRVDGASGEITLI